MASVHDPLIPDLFSGSARALYSPSPFPAAANPAKTERHILPSNLPTAVKHLNDRELEQLLSAVLAEQERRGTKRSTSDQSIRKPQAEMVAAPLSVGKLNAIRAAFKAGVKPSRIAREFGLPQSDVRRALAASKAR